MHPTIKQLFKLVSILLIGVTLVVGVLVFFNLNNVPIHNELATSDLLPQPEVFTELYFNDAANLPTSATSNRVINFAFVIHNLEATNYLYVYEVFVIASGTTRIVDTGNVFVKNNQYYVKNEKFNLMDSQGRQEVAVDLINLHQSIDFWIGG